ncbi:MAG: hypothetical protein KDC95_06970 [Planctomycetes bacterium]|nr:hypothetical protein [Planctomycetota bacterium]
MAGRPSLRLVAAAGLAVVVTACVFLVLAPPGSFPVGWDVWWNLHIARIFAEHGFPDTVVQGGFTQFARDYADRQWLFHVVLSTFGGARIGPEHVPWFVLSFGIALVAVLLVAARALGSSRIPVPAVLLVWGLSSSALFRATALRDMLLAILPLIGLTYFLSRASEGRAPGEREPRFSNEALGVFASGLVFTWSHGAPALLVALFVVVTIGRRLDGLDAALGRIVPLLVGIVAGTVLRPNPWGTIELLFTLNVEMPWKAMRGELPIQPAEFSAMPFGTLVRTTWALFATSALSVAAAFVQRRSWRLVLPAALLTVGTIFGARLVELAVPFTVLAVLVQLGDTRWSGRLPFDLIALVISCGLCALAVRGARPSVEANRFVVLEDVATTLRESARPGDVVFVTDWAVTSPLAFWTRDVSLRFTGVTDPVLMLHEAPEQFAAWWGIKSARDPNPVGTMRDVFGARFAVVGFADRAPGRPVGEASTRIWQGFGDFVRTGVTVRTKDFPMPAAHRGIEPGFRVYAIGD